MSDTERTLHRVLEGRITGHIDDEFYDTSLNNLIHAIVLYKEIYVLEPISRRIGANHR